MKNIDVGFVIDDNYVKYLSVTLLSILENKSEEDIYHFHVVHNGSITKENQNILHELCYGYGDDITFYAQSKKLHHEQREDTRQDIPDVTNYRLMISSILSDVEKIIFMDADLICLSDLGELWNVDLGKDYMASCPGELPADYVQKLGIPLKYKYCNTGVMLADLKKWRENNIETLLFEAERKYRGNYKFYDQCVFNIALYDKIKYIHQKFNYRPAVWNDKNFIPDFKNPCILHWAQPKKPWQDNTIAYANEYFKYVDESPYKWNILKLLYENKSLFLTPTKKNKKYLGGIVRKKIEGNKRIITILGVKIFSYKKKDK